MRISAAIIFLLFIANNLVAKEVSFGCTCYKQSVLISDKDNPTSIPITKDKKECLEQTKSLSIDIDAYKINGSGNYEFRTGNNKITWISEGERSVYWGSFDRITGDHSYHMAFEPLLKSGDFTIWEEVIVQYYKCKKSDKLL